MQDYHVMRTQEHIDEATTDVVLGLDLTDAPVEKRVTTPPSDLRPRCQRLVRHGSITGGVIALLGMAILITAERTGNTFLFIIGVLILGAAIGIMTSMTAIEQLLTKP